MSEQEINEAIAEACGRERNPDGGWYPDNGLRVGTQAIPDYCNDLNAMHEAEKALTIQQKENEYPDNLTQVVIYLKRGLTIGLVEYLGIHATARQRAEAFLRTFGKWEDAK